jgi:hypothetical protein
MSTIEQRRAWVLTKVMAGEIEVAEAAELLGLSVRSGLAPETAVRRGGPGRARPTATWPVFAAPDRRVHRDQVRVLTRGRYDGANDSHLAEHERITISRVGVRRIPRAAGIASPRRRRPPRQRGRRDRMPQAGMLLHIRMSRAGHRTVIASLNWIPGVRARAGQKQVVAPAS